MSVHAFRRPHTGVWIGMGRLGDLSESQRTEADQVVTQLTEQLARTSEIINQLQRAGFQADVVEQLRHRHTQLINALENAAGDLGTTSTGDYPAWRATVTELQQSIETLLHDVESFTQTGASRRTVMIVAGTVAALAVAGGITALIYYYGHAK